MNENSLFAGKRKDLEVDHDFLLKRMKHDADMQQREHATESRRLAWEKERAFLDQQALEDDMKRQPERDEEERRVRADEHCTYAAQQQAILSILEGIISRVNK